MQVNPSHKFIILASDGVWDFLSDEEAVKIVSSTNETDATKAAELLVIAALEQAAKESSNYMLDAKSTFVHFLTLLYLQICHSRNYQDCDQETLAEGAMMILPR